MKIAVIVVATKRYIEFVPPLWESIKKNFLIDQDVNMVVLTDGIPPEGTIGYQIKHTPWPGPTLMRYHYITRYREELSKFDYLYYLDADMLVVDKVGNEILGDLVGTIHPGYFAGQRGTYETRSESTAYVPDSEGTHYYAGGFNGGTSSSFLRMAQILKNNIDKDISNGIQAVWHDESHLNRYLATYPPSISLTPSYCYAEHLCPQFPKKIVALDKDHNTYREGV